MADTYFEDATHVTTLNGDEAIGITDDPGGTPSDGYITPDDLLKYVNSLTADTAPDNTADFALEYDTSASTIKKVLLQRLGAFQVHIEYSYGLDPADSTTYYFGSLGSTGATTTAADRRFYIARTGTIIAAYGRFQIGGTLGTTENNTVAIRLNNTSDTTVSSTIQLSAASVTYNNTSLSIAVTAGDYIEAKWTTPAFSTNPTSTYGTLDLLIA